MLFVGVNDVVCGEFGKCWAGTFCARPDGYDGPHICLHSSFLNHNFSHPFECHGLEVVVTPGGTIPTTVIPTSTSEAVARGSSVDGSNALLLVLMFMILAVLMVIAFLFTQSYRKILRPHQRQPYVAENQGPSAETVAAPKQSVESIELVVVKDQKS